MAFSYDETELDKLGTATGRLSATRLLVGDTDSNDPQVQDEEIAFALAQTANNIYYAAALVARTIASKYSRLVDTDLDGQLSEKYSQLQKHYKMLAKDLEFQGAKAGGLLGVAAGGLSKSEMKSIRENTDRVGSRIRIDQFRYDDVDYSDDYS